MRSSAWVSLRLLREAITRLNHGWEALPRAARWWWWATLAAGMTGVLALTAVLVWGARELEASGALAWERSVVRWVATELPISFSFGMWLEGLGNGFVLWALALYAAGAAAWAGRPLRALAFLLGYTLVYLPIGVGWWMWDRPRPQIVLQGIASPDGLFHAYPSGHVAQAAFAYGLLAWLWLRASASVGERLAATGAYALLIALVALGRLRIGAHWPSDLMAGAAIGLAWLAATVAALGRAERAAQSGNAAPIHPSTPTKSRVARPG